MERAFAQPRLASLLDHFSVVEDPRGAWPVAHPLPEVLLLVVCTTIASCDDFDDIAAWATAASNNAVPASPTALIGSPEQGA